jgi:hypothetical protein
MLCSISPTIGSDDQRNPDARLLLSRNRVTRVPGSSAGPQCLTCLRNPPAGLVRWDNEDDFAYRPEANILTTVDRTCNEQPLEYKHPRQRHEPQKPAFLTRCRERPQSARAPEGNFAWRDVQCHWSGNMLVRDKLTGTSTSSVLRNGGGRCGGCSASADQDLRG